MQKIKKILMRLTVFIFILSMNISTFANDMSINQLLSDPEWEGYNLGEDFYIDENGHVIYTYEQVEEIPIKYTNPETRIIDTSKLRFVIKYGYNRNTKELIFVTNVDAPSDLIFKPDISISLELKKSSSENGSYSTAVDKTNFGKVNYFKDYGIEYDGKSNHYKFIIHVRSNDPDTIVLQPTVTAYSCRNRTGKVWDFYKRDSYSGVEIDAPPTNWGVDQQHRPSNLNKTYQDNYNRTYGTDIQVGAGTGIEVHHVRPLKYGGSNSMSNLIHIPASFHSKITGWFSGY